MWTVRVGKSSSVKYISSRLVRTTCYTHGIVTTYAHNMFHRDKARGVFLHYVASPLVTILTDSVIDSVRYLLGVTSASFLDENEG